MILEYEIRRSSTPTSLPPTSSSRSAKQMRATQQAQSDHEDVRHTAHEALVHRGPVHGPDRCACEGPGSEFAARFAEASTCRKAKPGSDRRSTRSRPPGSSGSSADRPSPRHLDRNRPGAPPHGHVDLAGPTALPSGASGCVAGPPTYPIQFPTDRADDQRLQRNRCGQGPCSEPTTTSAPLAAPFQPLSPVRARRCPHRPRVRRRQLVSRSTPAADAELHAVPAHAPRRRRHPDTDLSLPQCPRRPTRSQPLPPRVLRRLAPPPSPS